MPSQTVRRPHDRHYFNRVKQKSWAKSANSVIEPSVDVAADVAAINRGAAVHQGDTYTVNERMYRLEPNGTLSPISGAGIHRLNRGAYKALGVYNTFGLSEEAEGFLANMHDVGPAERDAARFLWLAVMGEG